MSPRASLDAAGAPAVVGVAGVAAVAALSVLGPVRVLPFGCPFLTLTGWACPLCGGTRATAELARGDVGAALDLNAFAAIAMVVLAGAWAVWLLARLRGRRPVGALPAAVWYAVVVLGVGFTVLRNMPGPGSALAP